MIIPAMQGFETDTPIRCGQRAADRRLEACTPLQPRIGSMGSKVVDDEQLHLLHEALDWALITLHSARSEYRRLSLSNDSVVLIESGELMAARRNLYIAMQTVGEIKRKIRRRNLELGDFPQQMWTHNVFLH